MNRIVISLTAKPARQQSPGGRTPAGRPRNSQLNGAILDATRALVVKHGYIELSLAAVAEQAGTTTAAIYRRWSGKAQLVHEAVFPTEASEPAPVTGDSVTDVRAMVVGVCAIFSRPEVRIALPGLIADIQSDPALHSRMFGRLAEGLAVSRGSDASAAAENDFPEIIETIAGAAMFHAVARPGSEFNEQWIDNLTELLVKGYGTGPVADGAPEQTRGRQPTKKQRRRRIS